MGGNLFLGQLHCISCNGVICPRETHYFCQRTDLTAPPHPQVHCRSNTALKFPAGHLIMFFAGMQVPKYCEHISVLPSFLPKRNRKQWQRSEMHSVCALLYFGCALPLFKIKILITSKTHCRRAKRLFHRSSKGSWGGCFFLLPVKAFKI